MRPPGGSDGPRRSYTILSSLEAHLGLRTHQLTPTKAPFHFHQQEADLVAAEEDDEDGDEGAPTVPGPHPGLRQLGDSKVLESARAQKRRLTRVRPGSVAQVRRKGRICRRRCPRSPAAYRSLVLRTGSAAYHPRRYRRRRCRRGWRRSWRRRKRANCLSRFPPRSGCTVAGSSGSWPLLGHCCRWLPGLRPPA